jgi:hypothetical protein
MVNFQVRIIRKLIKNDIQDIIITATLRVIQAVSELLQLLQNVKNVKNATNFLGASLKIRFQTLITQQELEKSR